METEYKKTDWVGLIILALMLIGAVMVCYYLVTHDMISCTKDPIKFAFADSGYNFSQDYSYAEIRIFAEEEDLVPIFSKKIYSNS